MITAQMDISFINRTFRTTSVLTLIFLLFGFAYLDTYKVISVLSGVIWGMLNLLFLTLLIGVTVRPEGPDRRAALILAFFKLPIIYLAGYFLISNSYFDIIYLVIGFSILFFVIVMKVLGRLVLGMDDKNSVNNKRPQQEAV